MPDIAIPIVFPDYLIAVNTPRKQIDLLPGIDWFPDTIVIPETKNKVPDLGHAGILFINGKTGTTKYYEYGRYSPNGSVRKIPNLRDVRMGSDGHPLKETLSYTLSMISSRAGQNGRISGAYIEAPGKYQVMLNYAETRRKANSNANREPYDLFTNSCNHFMKGVLDAAGVDTPRMIDPRPNSYIEELRDMYRDLDYVKVTHTLSIENAPLSLARMVTTQAAA